MHHLIHTEGFHKYSADSSSSWLAHERVIHDRYTGVGPCRVSTGPTFHWCPSGGGAVWLLLRQFRACEWREEPRQRHSRSVWESVSGRTSVVLSDCNNVATLVCLSVCVSRRSGGCDATFTKSFSRPLQRVKGYVIFFHCTIMSVFIWTLRLLALRLQLWWHSLKHLRRCCFLHLPQTWASLALTRLFSDFVVERMFLSDFQTIFFHILSEKTILFGLDFFIYLDVRGKMWCDCEKVAS